MKGGQVKHPLTITVYRPLKLLVCNGLPAASYTANSGNASPGSSGIGLRDWATPAVVETTTANAATAKCERFIVRGTTLSVKATSFGRQGKEAVKLH